MEEKRLHISVSTILLIIAIFIIIVMGVIIYNLSKSKTKADIEIEQLKSDSQKMHVALTDIQETLRNVNVSNKASNTNNNENNNNVTEEVTTNKTKTEKEQVEEVANAFVKAVNEKDWNIVTKYSNNNVVSELKKYNVSNMSVDLNTLEKNPNQTNGYYCYDSYKVDYNGMDAKDLGMGRLFRINNENGTFVVSAFNATGL